MDNPKTKCFFKQVLVMKDNSIVYNIEMTSAIIVLLLVIEIFESCITVDVKY